MKSRPSALLLAAAMAAILLIAIVRPQAAAPGPSGAYEYATIRWDGAENTHVIRPDGSVQSAGSQLRDLRVPSRTDARAFYMNVVLNALAREGYELAASVQSDALIVRRPVR